LFEQLGANAQRGTRGPVTKSPAAELREQSAGHPRRGCFSEWIGNDGQVRALLSEMIEEAPKAQLLMLEEAGSEAS
jgi:hypothetical protein